MELDAWEVELGSSDDDGALLTGGDNVDHEETRRETCRPLGAKRDSMIQVGIGGGTDEYSNNDSVALLLWHAITGVAATRWWLYAISRRRFWMCGCKGA